jgi:hypothetical protein
VSDAQVRKLTEEVQKTGHVGDAAMLPAYVEEGHLVSEWSTVRVKGNAYSVPSRLIGHGVRVRVFESVIEVWLADTLDPEHRGPPGHLRPTETPARALFAALRRRVRKPVADERRLHRFDARHLTATTPAAVLGGTGKPRIARACAAWAPFGKRSR